MKPRVKQAISEASFETGISPEILIGPNKRRTYKAVTLRRAVIAKLYDPESAKLGGSFAAIKWGLSDIGRALELDHTTVLHHLRKMGIHHAQK